MLKQLVYVVSNSGVNGVNGVNINDTDIIVVSTGIKLLPAH